MGNINNLHRMLQLLHKDRHKCY